MIQLDKLLSLFNCTTPEEWGGAISRIAGDYGFSRTHFGIVSSKIVPFEKAFVTSNYPVAWRSHYDESKLSALDPIVLHCLDSMLPIVWSPDLFKGSEQNAIYEQAISYPLHRLTGEFGVLSFVTNDLDHAVNGRSFSGMADLSLLRDYAMESCLKFLRCEQLNGLSIKVTPREMECLRWIMHGKSSWEISQILHCAEATINFHVTNLKQKFNVHTRQQVVVKAIKAGLLTPM